MVSLRIERRGNGIQILDKIAKNLEGPSKVKVGFPSGGASSDIVMRAVWNEFGTTRIPERPFMRNSVRANRERYRAMATEGAKSILSDAMDKHTVLSRMGIAAQGDMQKEMPGTPPPNAPSTIRQKGSSTTLVDSGQMRQSVTWKVDE